MKMKNEFKKRDNDLKDVDIQGQAGALLLNRQNLHYQMKNIVSVPSTYFTLIFNLKMKSTC